MDGLGGLVGVGWGGDLTGLAAIQALMPICLSSFMAELASSCVIFQTVLHVVFSFLLPPLMRLYRVNIIRGGILCTGQKQTVVSLYQEYVLFASIVRTELYWYSVY